MKKMLFVLIATILMVPVFATAADQPSPRPTSSSAVVDVAQGRLDVNLATLPELIAVPGIGPSTAQAIIALRTKKGSFGKLEELIEVRGIGEKKLEALSAYLLVAQPAPAAASNTVSNR